MKLIEWLKSEKRQPQSRRKSLGYRLWQHHFLAAIAGLSILFAKNSN